MEYNNYLEEVEDMIYSIVYEQPNAESCKQRLKEYEQEHKRDIVQRQSQRADEERSIQDRIHAEQLERDNLRQEALEEERAIAAQKKRFKQESTQVLLGERGEVSAELRQAQMQGYRNEIHRQRRGRKAANFVSPRVREPPAWKKDPKDRQLRLKRQAAGGGLQVDSIVVDERNWNILVQTLFATPNAS